MKKSYGITAAKMVISHQRLEQINQQNTVPVISTILKSSGSVQYHLNTRGLGHWFVYQFSFLCGYMELCSRKSEKCCDNTKKLSYLSFKKGWKGCKLILFKKNTSQYTYFVRQARNVVRTYHNVTLTFNFFHTTVACIYVWTWDKKKCVLIACFTSNI